MENIENLIIECDLCGNKYDIKEIYKELDTFQVFQFEFEYYCKNCNCNKFNIGFEKIYDT